MRISKRILVVLAFSASAVAFPALSDTISPETFSADLDLNASVTIEKTVVVEATGPTDAVIDVHFLIDTSGSMGRQVDTAKDAASSLFSSLEADFGNVAASVGVFSELATLSDPRPNANAVIGGGLTTDNATFTANVNSVALGVPDGGGDFPESGFTGIALAGDDLAWRAGSNRFMFVFTDASAKGDLAGAQTTLAANDITLVALAYNFGYNSVNNGSSFGLGYGSELGATVFNSSTSVDDIIADVTAGITAGFAKYGSVTVGDLGDGLPMGIEVSALCTGADIGSCSGAEAIGSYDRETDRTFTFDVTFKRVAGGDAEFYTNALVDGKIVAREFDSFKDDTSVIPLPAGLPLLITAFGALAFAYRRRTA